MPVCELRQKSAWYVWKVHVGRQEEVKQGKEKEAKTMAALKMTQIKRASQGYTASKGPSQDSLLQYVFTTPTQLYFPKFAW